VRAAGKCRASEVEYTAGRREAEGRSSRVRWWVKCGRKEGRWWRTAGGTRADGEVGGASKWAIGPDTVQVHCHRPHDGRSLGGTLCCEVWLEVVARLEATQRQGHTSESLQKAAWQRDIGEREKEAPRGSAAETGIALRRVQRIRFRLQACGQCSIARAQQGRGNRCVSQVGIGSR
jgi:hypothetical protein